MRLFVLFGVRGFILFERDKRRNYEQRDVQSRFSKIFFGGDGAPYLTAIDQSDRFEEG